MKKNSLEILWIFARISAASFGGGYTVLPLMQHELVDQRGWLTDQELADIYALVQCQPGLIMINCAVLITVPRFGKAAGICAALGVMLPPLLVVLLVSSLLNNFAHLPAVQHALAGIRVSVAAMVVHTAWRMIKSGVRGWSSLLLFFLSLLLLFLDLVNPIFIILGSALCGILLGLRKQKGQNAAPANAEKKEEEA
ncbi:MAG: chromate transporter [Bacillota bacterium]|nr:chromate transporter [Bacillota bacterium]